jgi:hypothetical protein
VFNEYHLRSLARESNPELVVLCSDVLHLLRKTTKRLKEISSNNYGRGTEAVSSHNEASFRGSPCGTIGDISYWQTSTHPPFSVTDKVCSLLQSLDAGSKLVRIPKVVRVKEGHPRATCFADTQISRTRDNPII